METTTAVRTAASPTARILVVDDHLDSAEMLCNLLDRIGYEASSSFTLADAKARCAAEPFDLLILDRDLPDGDGGDLLRSCPTRAIALTGHAYPRDVIASRDAGFLDHLNKPVMFDELVRSIRAALRS
jgi:DNA-binding response OmpR family regulator